MSAADLGTEKLILLADFSTEEEGPSGGGGGGLPQHHLLTLLAWRWKTARRQEFLGFFSREKIFQSEHLHIKEKSAVSAAKTH